MIISPSDKKVHGLNTPTLKHLPLSQVPKGYCGEVPVTAVRTRTAQGRFNFCLGSL